MRVCEGCGTDISHRKADAKVCGRKCYAAVHRDRRNEQNRRCAKNRYEKNRKLLWEYLLEHPCEDCAESNPVYLELDHLVPAEKTAAISNVIMSWSWEKILTEIAKCRVLCANCHRLRTAEHLGWYRGEDIARMD